MGTSNRDFFWVALVFLVMLAVLLFSLLVASVRGAQDRAMPDITKYSLDNASYMGDVGAGCGKASMEVRRTKRPDEWVVVWYLNGKVLAVVFVYNGYYQFFIDNNFDGLWDSNGIKKTGEGSAADFYKTVSGCGNGWFGNP